MFFLLLILNYKSMMKFQNFEILYGAACEMLAAVGDNAVVANGVAKQKKVLLAQFAANFPRTLADAETHPGFDLLQFINMLLKFPETLKGQGEKLHTLIESIEGYNLEVPAELKRIAESMQEKSKSLSDREKEIADALRQSFPSDEKELESLPFPKKEVLDFLAAHPEATDGKRRQFICLMVDLCGREADLPTELKDLWRALVMCP